MLFSNPVVLRTQLFYSMLLGRSFDVNELMCDEEFEHAEVHSEEPVSPSQHCTVHMTKEPCEDCWEEDALVAMARAEPVAAKQPASAKRGRDELTRAREGLDNMPLPDLDEYFDEFGFDVLERVQLCRTYANHLSARLRAVKKRL